MKQRIHAGWRYAKRGWMGFMLSVYLPCSYANSAENDALGKLSSSLTGLGSKIHDLLKGPYAMVAVFALFVMLGTKMGASPLSAICLSLVGGAIFYAIGPDLVYAIFGGTDAAVGL